MNLLGEEYNIVNYDPEHKHIYLHKNSGGGVICFIEELKIFIIALYSDFLKFQNIDGLSQKQDLGMLIKAVSNAQKSLLKRSNLIV